MGNAARCTRAERAGFSIVAVAGAGACIIVVLQTVLGISVFIPDVFGHTTIFHAVLATADALRGVRGIVLSAV